MADDSDRMARAGDYVLGVMSESDRQRAERDLETDPSFRQAVVEAAERMHVFNNPLAQAAPDLAWATLKERLGELPQMRTATASPRRSPAVMVSAQPLPRIEPEAPVTFGRRRTDFPRATLQPAVPKAMPAISGNRALLLAACVIAAFALGYVVGVNSTLRQPPAIAQPPLSSP